MEKEMIMYRVKDVNGLEVFCSFIKPQAVKMANEVGGSWYRDAFDLIEEYQKNLGHI